MSFIQKSNRCNLFSDFGGPHSVFDWDWFQFVVISTYQSLEFGQFIWFSTVLNVNCQWSWECATQERVANFSNKSLSCTFETAFSRHVVCYRTTGSPTDCRTCSASFSSPRNIYLKYFATDAVEKKKKTTRHKKLYHVITVLITSFFVLIHRNNLQAI